MVALSRSCLVSAQAMEQVESTIFAGGLPVEALMEKAGLRLVQAIERDFALSRYSRIGVLVGPGHNGGDALVVARELLLAGRTVFAYCPRTPAKPLTASHLRYFQSLGGSVSEGEALDGQADLWIDGLFGFGLTRPVTSPYAQIIDRINASGEPIAAIDLPSGLSSDGAVLGTAIRARRTYCLGLWKRGLWQDTALPYLGSAERLDLGIRDSQIQMPIAEHLLLPEMARSYLPLSRPPLAYKYSVGTVLAIAGSHQYSGAPLLVALGARAGGPGMLYLAVPESLPQRLSPELPEAIFYPCPEAANGTIADLPLDLGKFDAVVCGPGLGKIDPKLVERVVGETKGALLLDADALNVLADGLLAALTSRRAPTVLTPHAGEFKRLFGDIDLGDRLTAASEAARRSGAWIVLKGARSVVASPEGSVWVNTGGSSALARGGSGDVLSGLAGALLAQSHNETQKAMLAAVWWHAAAGEWLAGQHTVLGVDPRTLALGLLPFLVAS